MTGLYLAADLRVGQTMRHAPGATDSRVDGAMVKALAWAFRWQRMLDDGVCATIEELAGREWVNRGYMSRVLRLTLLAPEIVEAILEGRQTEGFRFEDLLDGFPVEVGGAANCAANQKAPTSTF